jgi:hypothetical protein
MVRPLFRTVAMLCDLYRNRGTLSPQRSFSIAARRQHVVAFPLCRSAEKV